MSSVSVEAKDLRIKTSKGLTCASYITLVVKGRDCVVLIDESENGPYVAIRDCLDDVAAWFHLNDSKIMAFKDTDKQWNEVVIAGAGKGNIKTHLVHGAVPNCSAIEIPYLILIEEVVA
ncbi:hypothetical protein [Vibrio sp. THAF190c]|jgi:hypothetical protein|uniref:hypothetical protein n=1 Tax=Vibrio sp. THAF190c TaxID=2587865 RepID=UPI001268DF89|nr:hypothetical protein [Vibrio sp. THAF190c]QFT13360.1 hypothetical protein FIV04_25755 [Vibrio sp. THAF190c]